MPASLRYQACDETICYAPATADDVAGRCASSPQARRSLPRTATSFDRIAFGHGEAPTHGVALARRVAPRRAGRDAHAGLADARRLHRARGTTGGYLGSADFLKFIHNAENGVQAAGLFEGRGPLAILLIVFLGGLALNLTPCVLPMIPINLAIIGAGAQAGSRSRGFLLGAAYGAAMALVYGVLGLIVILTAGHVRHDQLVAVVQRRHRRALRRARAGDVRRPRDRLLALLERRSARTNRSRGTFLRGLRHGRRGGAARGRLRRAGRHSGRAVLEQPLRDRHDDRARAAVLPRLGMAIPWPIAGAGLAALPKPGAWMVRVKQAFGVLILATAVYYGYAAYSLFANRWVDAVRGRRRASRKS